MTTTSNILHATVEFATVKIVGTILFAVFSFFFGSAYTMGILAILMLLIIDTITGIWAARHEGETISSKRAASVIKKFTLYGMAISTGYFMDIAVQVDILFAQATIVSFIALTEGISILENVSRLGLIVPPVWLKKLKDIQSQK